MLWRTPWLRQRLTLMGLAVWDGLVLVLGYNVIYWWRLQEWVGTSRALALLILLWISISYLLGRYSQTQEGLPHSILHRLGSTVLVAGLILAVIVGHSWLFHVREAETRFRGFLLPLVGLTMLASALGQMVALILTISHKRWLLICTSSEIAILTAELNREPPARQQATTILSLDEIESLEGEQLRSQVALAVSDLGGLSERQLQRLLQLRSIGVQVSSLVEWAEHNLQRVPPELLSNHWLLKAEGFSMQPGRLAWRVKRLGDLAGSSALLALSSPLVALSALLIWLEDRGPVFYSQLRTGLYEEQFRIWKLRTMRIHAESAGAQWAARSDPRITKVGKYLRLFRIDELPQLVAVLKGDMSLIGPRPERREIEQTLERTIPLYRVRHWIRPGLSGWAQVCYPYGASIADSRMKLSYDVYYLHNAGILLDSLITLKTIRLVLGAQGAVPAAPEPTPSPEVSQRLSSCDQP